MVEEEVKQGAYVHERKRETEIERQGETQRQTDRQAVDSFPLYDLLWGEGPSGGQVSHYMVPKSTWKLPTASSFFWAPTVLNP